jgi:hypothetical protein
MAGSLPTGRYRSMPGRGGVLLDPPRPRALIPAFLDDPALSVTLAQARASIAFERDSKQLDDDTRAAREARSASANRKG